MACRAMDAGDTEAAKKWLKQVLVFDPTAKEPREELDRLERREIRKNKKAPAEKQPNGPRQKSGAGMGPPKPSGTPNQPRER